jgi:hypothetical protein
MTGPRVTRSVVRRAGWLACVALTLGGLVGMHGLDTHDAMSVAGDHGSMGVMAPQVSAQHVSTGQVPIAGMAMGCAGTCVAVLGLALLLLALRRHPAGTGLLTRALSHVRPTAFRGRDPDPPTLLQLSVSRC